MSIKERQNALLDRVYLLGTGLIGGSLALDIRESGLVGEIVGDDADRTALQCALDSGILDRQAPMDAETLASCDLVILAVPVVTLSAILEKGFPPGTLVTDVGSVKGSLMEAYQRGRERGAAFSYVPGHPIAGDERSGPLAARKGLFRGARVILTPVEGTDRNLTDVVVALWQSVGARVEFMDAAEHDEIFAWVSHLPHVAAYAIVDAVMRKDRSWVAMSGGGLRDYTRIAASSPRMWAEIAVANRERVLEAMAGLAEGLDEIRQAVLSSDRDELESIFERIASQRREGG